MALQSYFDTVIAFGDSYSSQCGFSLSSSNEPTSATWTDFSHGLYNNPILDDCSATGGWNYLNFMTQCTGNAEDPLTCPIRLIDFAYDGATAWRNSTLDGDELPVAMELDGQIAQWTEVGSSSLSFVPLKTLAVLWFGIDSVDTIAAALELDSTTLNQTIKFHFDQIEEALQTLHEGELRNFFVPNIPLIRPEVATIVEAWNTELSARLEVWSSLYSDTKFSTFDVYNTFKDFQTRPQKHGFTQVSKSCHDAAAANDRLDCSSQDSGYLMMDDAHWTTQTHLSMADLMETAIIQQLYKFYTDSSVFSHMPSINVPTRMLWAIFAITLVISAVFIVRWLWWREVYKARQRYAVIKNEDSA